MKTLKALSTKILAVLLLLPAMASAAPLLINYQGRLVDTAGNPLTGAQSILFSVYDAASAGSLLWSETQSVTPDNGIFSVSLGGVQTLPAAVFASDALYLEVKIGADAPLTPRTRLLSVPYALSAANLGSPSSVVTVSTHIVVSASQLRLGNFASAPSASIGGGAMFYNTTDNQLYYHNGTTWNALAAGGISPWGRSGTTVSLNNVGDKVTMSNTAADALTVSGGIVAGSGSVGIVGADGRIPALSSLYLANLSGSALTGLSAAQVGLGSVDNTADADKPVSTAQQTALNLKAPLDSPAFTGNVSGVTAAMVGLGSVDNTADADKPVSTAQLAALSTKAIRADVSADTMTLRGLIDGKAIMADVSADTMTLKGLIDGKQATIIGAATTITASDLTGDRALLSDSSGKVAVSAVTNTELGYLAGVSSALQTQLDAKAIMADVSADTMTLKGLIDGKQATGDYITSLTGPITASGPGAAATSITAGAVGTAQLADAGVTKAKLAVEAGCDAGDILKVAGGVWTCDLDAGAAAGVSGTGVANQVSFWDGASSIAGDTDLTFNSATGILTATGFAGPLAGNVTGNLIGNADTATAAVSAGSADTLSTPRAINGTNFDGSAAITVPVNSADDNATSATM
ncbi:MAG TPA: hypothetical protein DCQ25_02525, partial [Elusimicrobia bacterium]|nr:hypothetical protein [Elusimicrobiota bacterium]